MLEILPLKLKIASKKQEPPFSLFPDENTNWMYGYHHGTSDLYPGDIIQVKSSLEQYRVNTIGVDGKPYISLISNRGLNGYDWLPKSEGYRKVVHS